MSAAIIYAAYVESLLMEPIYMIIIKIFAMGIGLCGLVIGLLRIPKENLL